jgi:hypothetical protein
MTGIPEGFPHFGRAVDFIAELTDEADAQDADRDAGRDSRCDIHVGKGFCRQVNVGFKPR